MGGSSDLYSRGQDACRGIAKKTKKTHHSLLISTRLSLPLSLSDVRAAREQINMGGVTYPTLPLQEAVHRPQSAYGPQSLACSPSGSFARPLPPQPHSAYFSGMTGPQHPFYNRVRQEVLEVSI